MIYSSFPSIVLTASPVFSQPNAMEINMFHFWCCIYNLQEWLSDVFQRCSRLIGDAIFQSERDISRTTPMLQKLTNHIIPVALSKSPKWDSKTP